MSFVREFDALFVGRRDVHAEGYPDADKPGKVRYVTIRKPLTFDVLSAHLRGDTKGPIGVYPICQDNTVGWWAIDFDAPTDDEGNEVADPFAVAWEVAVKQAGAFERVGLHVYLERSRSGKGVHVWGFLESPMPAGQIRLALKSLLTDHEIFTSRDRMFPVQDELTDETSLGNLIALPFYGNAGAGNSAFLDPTTQEPINPRDFVASVKRNAVAVLEALAAEAAKQEAKAARQFGGPVLPGDFRPRRPITGALKMISKYGCPFMHHSWINRKTIKEPQWYAALGQCTVFEHGRELAHLISRDYRGYSVAEVNAKFDQATENPPVGYGWLEESYPDIVGVNHGGKAPYHVAKRTILELASSAKLAMEHVGSFTSDLTRIRRLDNGEEASGITCGLPNLDEVFRFRNGELIIIGGMQSLGKTAFMIDLITRLARDGVTCFVFSAETGRDSLRNRLLARIAEVDGRALRRERRLPLSKEEWKRLEHASAELETLPIYEDYTSLNADDVLRQVEYVLLSKSIPLDSPYVIFFDYLQFGSKLPGEDTEYDRLSRLTSEFKFTAKILDHPTVVLSQLKREMEGNDKPDITWFKGTGRIESDMDAGLIITGDRVVGVVAPRALTIVKQREGEANVVLNFMLQQDIFRWDPIHPTSAVAKLFSLEGEDD